VVGGLRSRSSWEEGLKNQINEVLETPRDFADRVGLEFTDWFLLSRALTHRSYLNEHPEALEDNERLEFLGDAVLDFVVGAWLYNRYPEMPEGDLTRMRSALVYTEQLAAYALELGLGNVLFLGKGESRSGGRTRAALLCDTFEALIGALFLDSGIEAVQQFMGSFLEKTAIDILKNHSAEDPKSRLQEWVQSQGNASPQYVVRDICGPDHSRVFQVEVEVNGKVYGSGEGRSKQAATKDAARAALIQLGLDE
jgi:ribonuclease III